MKERDKVKETEKERAKNRASKRKKRERAKCRVEKCLVSCVCLAPDVDEKQKSALQLIPLRWPLLEHAAHLSCYPSLSHAISENLLTVFKGGHRS